MPLVSRHLDLGPAYPANGWRNIAIGTWKTAKDPSVYGVLEIDATAALARLEELTAKTGERVTITAMVGKAVADAFARHPEINAVMRFGRIYPRKSVTLFFQVATDKEGQDLSGVTVQTAETKSIVEIAREIGAKTRAVRERTDRSYAFIKGLMRLIPGVCARLVLDLSSFIQYTLNIWSPLLGTPRDPLGSVMISNVGPLGLEFGFAPLVPYSRVPMVIAVGAVRDRVVAIDGEPRVRPMLRLCVTFDHRLIDGVHAAKIAAAVEAGLR